MSSFVAGPLVQPVLASAVSIDWTTLIAQVVNFVVLVWLLKRFLYAPITGAMERREQSITDRIESAEQQQALARVEHGKYTALVEQHERRSDEMLQEARDAADAFRSERLEGTRSDIDRQRVEWEESFRQERAAVLDGFRAEIGRRVLEATEHALESLADARLQEQIIEVFLDRIREARFESLDGEPLRVRTSFTLTPDLRDRLRVRLAESAGVDDVEFESTSDLICGISVIQGGHAVEWSIDQFLEELGRDDEGSEEAGGGWVSIGRERTA